MMRVSVLLAALGLNLAVLLPFASAGDSESMTFKTSDPARDQQADLAAAGHVLDRLHQLASTADWDGYFALYAETARFIGTDITEVWTKDQLRTYASKAEGGWTYFPSERQITISPDGRSAYFHEILDHARLGKTRGTGTLIRAGGSWRIAQYHLTLPIPNAMIADVAQEILSQK